MGPLYQPTAQAVAAENLSSALVNQSFQILYNIYSYLA
jgi:hypothetical protein